MWPPTSLKLVLRSMQILDALSKEGEEGVHPFRFHRVGSTTLVPLAGVTGARRRGRRAARLGIPGRRQFGNAPKTPV